MSKSEDQYLLSEIAEGNRQAFRMFYDTYKSIVYNTVLSYLQNKEEAEEVTQDVFFTVFNKAGTFKGNSKVSTWIYRITVNKALNQIKRRKKIPLSIDELKEHQPIEFIHPGVQLENQEKAKYLFAAIENLVEKQKTAIILSFIEDLPRQEVAQIMNTSLKSVESLLQRAKTNLKKQLKEMYPKEF